MKVGSSILDLKLVPYGMELHVLVTHKDWIARVNANRDVKFGEHPLIEENHKHSSGLCAYSKTSPGHIWVGIFSEPSKEAEVLVHELVHALEHVIDYIGLPRGYDQSEPSAHLMKYMFAECIVALRKHRERKKTVSPSTQPRNER